MAIFVEGVRGSGKSKIAVREIQTYLKAGRKVATNLDVDADVLCPERPVTYTRLPDIPRSSDFQLLGKAYPELDPDNPDTYDESKFGLVVIDELLVSFNARNWNDKDRLDVVSWFVQSRKLGWRVWLLCQDVDAVDKQLRETLLQEIWYCRSGRNFFSHPILSKLFGVFTKPLMALIAPMGFHILTIYTGKKKDKINVAGREFYKLYDLHKAYKTSQNFLPDGFYNAKGAFVDMRASYTVLPKSYFSTKPALAKEVPQLASEGMGPKPSFRSVLTSTPVLLAAMVGAFYFAFQSSTSSDVMTNPVTSQIIEQTKQSEDQSAKPASDDPFAGVSITCSVKRSDGGDYCFEKDGEPFYPNDLGYNVVWYRPCLALVSDDTQERRIKCTGKRRHSEAVAGAALATAPEPLINKEPEKES